MDRPPAFEADGNYRRHKEGAGTREKVAFYFDPIEPDIIRLTIHFRNDPVSYILGVTQLEQALNKGSAPPEYDDVRITLVHDATAIVFTFMQARASISLKNPEFLRLFIGQVHFCVAHTMHATSVEEGIAQLEAHANQRQQ